MSLDLEPIDNALILATPGPWEYIHNAHDNEHSIWSDSANGGKGLHLAEFFPGHPPDEADAHLIANAPAWLRQMHDEIVRLRGRLALARGEVESVVDEAASFHMIPPTKDDIVSLCAGLQIAKRAQTANSQP